MFTLYRAEKETEKGSIGFYIQSDTLSDYAALGYTIVKMEPVVVEDVQAEEEAAVAKLK